MFERGKNCLLVRHVEVLQRNRRKKKPTKMEGWRCAGEDKESKRVCMEVCTNG